MAVQNALDAAKRPLDEAGQRPGMKGYRMTRRISLSLLLALALAACGQRPTPDPNPQPSPAPQPTEVGQPIGEPVRTTIGPAGGTLASADGALTLTVPAGALAGEETVALQEISNFAPGRVGRAFRLSPEGVAFAQPVTIQFSLGEEAGGSPADSLAVAYQTSEGYWVLPAAQSYDAASRTLTVTTAHFSDWSPVAGAQLNPWSARVKVGQAVALSLQICDEDDALPLPMPDGTTEYAYACYSNVVLERVVRNWSVNGVPGGNSGVGTIARTLPGRVTYTAPATKPAQNPVAVSVEYSALDGKRVTLVANVTVEDDAADWSGTVTYREEGSKAWEIPEDWEGEGVARFQQAYTFSVVGAEEVAAGTVRLLLAQKGAAEYTDLGHMEKKVYAICQAGGPTILRTHFIYDRNVKNAGSVDRQLEAYLYLRDGQYRLSLEPRSFASTHAETVTDKMLDGCFHNDVDSSYSKAYASVIGSGRYKIEGAASSDTFSGTYTEERFFLSVPTTAHVEWNLVRRP
jgi:hypothetical protein